MVQGGMTIIRYITFAFNFIFVICGIALIVVGGIAKHQGKNITLFLGSNLPAASVLVIIAGCVVLLLAFLGCCGALKESYCMLMTFSVLLFLLLIVEVAAGITGAIFRNKLQTVIKDNMLKSMKNYNASGDATRSWDYIQKEFKCCGVNSSEDWITAIDYIPLTCCKAQEKGCTGRSEDIFNKGCFEEMKNKISHYSVQIIVAAFVIAFIQLLGMIFGCCLANAIKKEYETV